MIAIVEVALQQYGRIVYFPVEASSIGALTSEDKYYGLWLRNFTARPTLMSVRSSMEH